MTTAKPPEGAATGTASGAAPGDGAAAVAPSAKPAPLAPLRGGQLIAGTIALSLATFMNVLDTSIANVSIPAIAGDNGVSPSQGTWVITSFAVSTAITVPLTGWLAQRFGQVKVFLYATLLFTLASLLCALAPNLQLLIAARVMQGLVAGPMIPMSQALLLSSYPPARAGIAMALWVMTTLVAPIIGPPLGGWISDNLSWPWIFYINIPVGFVAAWVTATVFRGRETMIRQLPVDFVGLGLLVVWVGSMQIMLDKGRELDWFNAPEIWVLAILAVVGFVIFLIWELTDEHPVVDLSLFRIRNFAIGTSALALAYGLFFGNVVLIPLWLQQYMGYTATDAGLVLAPVGFLALLLSPIIGKNINKLDSRMLATVSFICFAGVLWMRSRFTTGTDFDTIALPALFQGIAMACMFIPLNTILLSGVGPERLAAASGLSNFVRIAAGAAGTSLTTTLWDNRAQLHHAQLAERISDYNSNSAQAVAQMQSQGLTQNQALGRIDRMIDAQSYTLAADELFYIAAGIFILLIGLIWLAKVRPAPAVAGAAAGSDAH
jgi:DHA2 family multidrug resistance protein